MKHNIYLDHAATTSLCEEARIAMEPFLSEKFANPSTAYDDGVQAKKDIAEARQVIAHCIGANAREIFFTSGGSESDNWAIKSVAGAYKKKGQHILTSSIEHHAVLNSCEYLENLGYDVEYLPVDSMGIVNPQRLAGKIRKDTTLVTIMFANNEIGTIEPITEIGHIARNRGVLFHTDGVQVVGQIPIFMHEMPVDMMSASAHKFHGPKGTGFLYVKEGIDVPAFIHGGGQEEGKRAGTENVAGIVGMAAALKYSTRNMAKERIRLTKLRNLFLERVLREIPQTKINGHLWNRLPGNINVSFKGVDATSLLILLEENGIMASAGSACNTSKQELSHVIQAIGVPEEYGIGTIRFTMGKENTLEDILYTIRKLKESVEILRKN